MNMNYSAMIQSRRSVRAFRSREVSAETIAGLRAYYETEALRLFPEIGTELRIGKRLARLERVEPFTRKSDGAASFLLFWRIGDRLATSGLRGSGVYWVRGEDA